MNLIQVVLSVQYYCNKSYFYVHDYAVYTLHNVLEEENRKVLRRMKEGGKVQDIKYPSIYLCLIRVGRIKVTK